MTTTSTFQYISPASYASTTTNPSGANKPWGKVDGGGTSYTMEGHTRTVHNMRGHESELGTDVTGFALHHAPATERNFTDEAAIRSSYYAEIEALVRAKLPEPGELENRPVKKVVIFDHTIRRNEKASARQPVQQVHVDQTPAAAAARVRRHIADPEEAEALLRGRYQIVNVWRPIGHPASDFPLALVDYRSTTPKDLVAVDLLYPKRDAGDDGDDRGKEVLPDSESRTSTERYEVKGETFGVAPSEGHKFWYAKDMTPDEVVFIKCFDSRSEVNGGPKGVAAYTPHTAFVDPLTSKDAPGRQSIEVRCLVFYE